MKMPEILEPREVVSCTDHVNIVNKVKIICFSKLKQVGMHIATYFRNQKGGLQDQ